MDIHSRNLFIDTQFFVGKAFNFSSKEISALKNLAQKGQVNIYLVDITYYEIQKKITEFSAAAYKKIESADCHILKNAPLFRQFLFTYGADRFKNFVYEQFSQFVVDSKVQIIDVDKVKPTSVFLRYFNEQSPFKSSKTKDRRAEFPDAFVWEALLNWCSDNNDRCYILSGDSDWEQTTKDHYDYLTGEPYIYYLKELAPFIDAIVRTDIELDDLKKLGVAALEKNKTKIEDAILKVLREVDFESDAAQELDAIIVNQHLENVSIESYEILDPTDDSCSFSLQVSCHGNFMYKISDYENAPWDSEARAYLYVDKISLVKIHTFTFDCELEISIKNKLPSLIEIVHCDIDTPVQIEFDETNSFTYEEWLQSRPVMLVGVSDGVITESGTGYQQFQNIAEAKQIFPDLMTTSTQRFTGIVDSTLTGHLRIETWQAQKFYSE